LGVFFFGADFDGFDGAGLGTCDALRRWVRAVPRFMISTF
jgi:hypothetical protein